MKCTTCNGTGLEADGAYHTCTTCNGSGVRVNPVRVVFLIPEDTQTALRTPPKPYAGCPILQAEKDRKLRAALLAEFNSADIADRAMRVIKGMR